MLLYEVKRHQAMCQVAEELKGKLINEETRNRAMCVNVSENFFIKPEMYRLEVSSGSSSGNRCSSYGSEMLQDQNYLAIVAHPTRH